MFNWKPPYNFATLDSRLGQTPRRMLKIVAKAVRGLTAELAALDAGTHSTCFPERCRADVVEKLAYYAACRAHYEAL